MKHAIALLFVASIASAATITQQYVATFGSGDGGGLNGGPLGDPTIFPFDPSLGQFQGARFDISLSGWVLAGHDCAFDCDAESIGWSLEVATEIQVSDTIGGRFESTDRFSRHEAVTSREITLDEEGFPMLGSYITAYNPDVSFSLSRTPGNLPLFHRNSEPLMFFIYINDSRTTGSSPANNGVYYEGTIRLTMNYDYAPVAVHTPEPSTLALASATLIALAVCAQHRRRRPTARRAS